MVTIMDCKICTPLKCMWFLTGRSVSSAFTRRDLNHHIIWYNTSSVASKGFQVSLNPREDASRAVSAGVQFSWSMWEGDACMGPWQGLGSTESQCFSHRPCKHPGKGQKKSEGRGLMQMEWAISGYKGIMGSRIGLTASALFPHPTVLGKIQVLN